MDYAVLIIHTICAYVIFGVILIRAFPIVMQKKWSEHSTLINKVFVAIQHLGYSILIVSGLYLLSRPEFEAGAWFYAKIILFFVMLSASIKAFQRKKQIPLVQRQAGLVIAIIAFCAIFALVFVKPQLG